MVEPAEKSTQNSLLDACISRRRFLMLSAATVSVVAIEGILPGQLVTAERAEFEGRMVGKLSALRVGEPMPFSYPWDHPNAQNLLIKLGTRAGGGIGPDEDVVAFNTICPHMGFPMQDSFDPEHQVLGPCGWHLSTYDLTRHGIIVSGHATSGLPQITLQAQGDEVYATGVQSLIFGFSDNELDPSA
jgi:arsenite oxidase small subunit